MRKSQFMVSILTTLLVFSCCGFFSVSSFASTANTDKSSIPGSAQAGCHGTVDGYTLSKSGSSCEISPSTSPTSDGKLVKLTINPDHSFRIEVKKSSSVNDIYAGSAGSKLSDIEIVKTDGTSSVKLSTLAGVYSDIYSLLTKFKDKIIIKSNSSDESISSSSYDSSGNSHKLPEDTFDYDTDLTFVSSSGSDDGFGDSFKEFNVDKVAQVHKSPPSVSITRAPFVALIKPFGSVEGDITGFVDQLINQILGKTTNNIKSDEDVPLLIYKDKDGTPIIGDISLSDFSNENNIKIHEVTDKISSSNGKVKNFTQNSIVGNNSLFGDSMNDPRWISDHAELIAVSLGGFGRKDKSMTFLGYIPLGVSSNDIKVLQSEVVGGGYPDADSPRSSYIGPDILYGADSIVPSGSKEVISGVIDKISIQNQLKKKIFEFLLNDTSSLSDGDLVSKRMDKYLLARKFNFVQDLDLSSGTSSGSPVEDFSSSPNARISVEKKNIGIQLYNAYAKGLKEIDNPDDKKTNWSEVVTHFKSIDNYDTEEIAAAIREIYSTDVIESDFFTRIENVSDKDQTAFLEKVTEGYKYSPVILLGSGEKTGSSGSKTGKYNLVSDVTANIKAKDVKNYLFNEEQYNKVCTKNSDPDKCKAKLESIKNNLVVDIIDDENRSAIVAAKYIKPVVSLEIISELLESDGDFGKIYKIDNPKFDGIFDLYLKNVFKDENGSDSVEEVVTKAKSYSRSGDSVKKYLLNDPDNAGTDHELKYPFLIHRHGKSNIPGFVWNSKVEARNLDSSYLAANTRFIIESLAGLSDRNEYGDSVLKSILNDETQKKDLIVRYAERLDPDYQVNLLIDILSGAVDSDVVSKKGTVKEFVDSLLSKDSYIKGSKDFKGIIHDLKNKIPGDYKDDSSIEYLPELLHYGVGKAKSKVAVFDDFILEAINNSSSSQVQDVNNDKFAKFADSITTDNELGNILDKIVFEKSKYIDRVINTKRFLESFIGKINKDSSVKDKGKEVSKYIKIFGNKDDKSSGTGIVSERDDLDKDYKDIGKKLDVDVSKIFKKSTSYEALHQLLANKFVRQTNNIYIDNSKSVNWSDVVLDVSDKAVLDYIKSIDLRVVDGSTDHNDFVYAKYLPVQVVRANKKEIIFLKDLLVSDLHGLSYGYGSVEVPSESRSDSSRAKMDPKNSHLNMILTSFIRDNFIAESEISANNAKGVLGYSEDKLKNLVKVIQKDLGNSSTDDEKKKVIDGENSETLNRIIRNVLAKVEWSGEPVVPVIEVEDSQEKKLAKAKIIDIRGRLFSGALDSYKKRINYDIIGNLFTGDASEQSKNFVKLEKELSKIRLLFESSFEDKLNQEREEMANPVHGSHEFGIKLNDKAELDKILEDIRILHAEHYMELRREKPVHVKPYGMLSSIDSLFSKDGDSYSLINKNKFNINTVLHADYNIVSGDEIELPNKVFGKSGRALWYLCETERQGGKKIGDVKYVKIFSRDHLSELFGIFSILNYFIPKGGKTDVEDLFNETLMESLKEFILRKENADLAATFVDRKVDLSSDVDVLSDHYLELLNIRRNIHYVDLLKSALQSLSTSIQGKINQRDQLNTIENKTKDQLNQISVFDDEIKQKKEEQNILQREYDTLLPRYNRLKVIYDVKKSKFGFDHVYSCADQEKGCKGSYIFDTKETYGLSLVRQAIKDAGIITGDSKDVKNTNDLIRLGDNNPGSPLSKHRYNKDFLGTFSVLKTPGKDDKYDYLNDDELAVLYNSKVFLTDDRFKSITELAFDEIKNVYESKSDAAKLSVRSDSLNNVIASLSEGFKESFVREDKDTHSKRVINVITFSDGSNSYLINQCWKENSEGTNCKVDIDNDDNSVKSIGYVSIISQGVRAANSGPSLYPDIAFNKKTYDEIKNFLIENNLLKSIDEVLGFNELKNSIRSKHVSNVSFIKEAKDKLRDRVPNTISNKYDSSHYWIRSLERIYAINARAFDRSDIGGIVGRAKDSIKDKNNEKLPDNAVKKFTDKFNEIFDDEFNGKFAIAEDKLELFDKEIGEFVGKYHLGKYRKKITDKFKDSIVKIYDFKADSSKLDLISGISDFDWVNILEGKSAFVLDIEPASDSLGKGYRAHMFINGNEDHIDNFSYYGGISGDNSEAILSLPRFASFLAEKLLFESEKEGYNGIDDLLGYIQFNTQDETLGKKFKIPVSRKDITFIGDKYSEDNNRDVRLALHSILSDPNNGSEVNRHLNKLSSRDFIDKFTSVAAVLYSDSPDKKYLDFIDGMVESGYDINFFADDAGIYSMRIQAYDLDKNEIVTTQSSLPKFGKKIDEISLTSYWSRSDLLAQEAYVEAYSNVLNTGIDGSCNDKNTQAEKIVCSKKIAAEKAADRVYKDQVYRLVLRNMDDIADSPVDKIVFYNSKFYDYNSLFYNRSLEKYDFKKDGKIFGLSGVDLFNEYYVDGYVSDENGKHKLEDLFVSLEDVVIDSCSEYSSDNFYSCLELRNEFERLFNEDSILKSFKSFGYNLIQIENGINGIERHEFGSWSDKSTVRLFIDSNKQEIMKSLISSNYDLVVGSEEGIKYRDLLSSLVKPDPIKLHQKFLEFLSSSDNKHLFRLILKNGKVEEKNLDSLISNVSDLYVDSGVAWMTIDAIVNGSEKRCFVYEADCNKKGHDELSSWFADNSNSISSEVASSLARNKHFTGKVKRQNGSFKLSDFSTGIIYWGIEESNREFLSTYYDDDLLSASKEYIRIAKDLYSDIGNLKLRGYYDNSISRIGDSTEIDLKLSDLEKDFSKYRLNAINIPEENFDDNIKKYLALYHSGVVGSKLDIVNDNFFSYSNENVEVIVDSYFSSNKHLDLYTDEIVRQLYFKVLHIVRESESGSLAKVSIYKDLDGDMFDETEYKAREHIIINGNKIAGKTSGELLNGKKVYRDAVTFFDFTNMLNSSDLDLDSKKDLFRTVIYDSLRKEGYYKPEVSRVIGYNKFVILDLSSSSVKDSLLDYVSSVGIENDNIFGRNFASVNSFGKSNIRLDFGNDFIFNLNTKIGYLCNYGEFNRLPFNQGGLLAGLSSSFNYLINDSSAIIGTLDTIGIVSSIYSNSDELSFISLGVSFASGYKFKLENGLLAILGNGIVDYGEVLNEKLSVRISYRVLSRINGSYDLSIDEYNNINFGLGIGIGYENMNSLIVDSDLSIKYFNDISSFFIGYGFSSFNFESINKLKVGLSFNI